MPTRRLFLLLIPWMLLSGCAKPLPDMRANYVGHWQGENVQLSIFADGRIAYVREGKDMNTKIDAPIIEFKGDDFVVGFWFLTTTFVVSEAPHQVDGQWQMVVDGVRLTRGGAAPNPQPPAVQQKITCSSCLQFPAV